MQQIEDQQQRLKLLEKLVGLSVELHNLNAGVQRRYELSIVQWLVLKKIVEQPGLSAGTLAELLKIHPSTLTPTLTRLEVAELIYILERPSDLRRKLLVASWKGLEWSRRSEGAFLTAMNSFEHHPTALQLDVDGVRALISRLIKNLEKGT